MSKIYSPFITFPQLGPSFPKTGGSVYFDGTDDYGSSNVGTATANFFGACEISLVVTLDGSSAATTSMFALSSSAYRIGVNSSRVLLVNGDVSTSLVVPAGRMTRITVGFDSSGNAISASVGSNQFWSGSAAAGGVNNNLLYIGARNAASVGRFFKGVIHNVSCSSAANPFFYRGLGNTNQDWVDYRGNFDITLSGSPALYGGQILT